MARIFSCFRGLFRLHFVQNKKLLYIKRGITWPDRNQPVIGLPKTENSLRAVPLTNAFLKALQYNGQKGYILQRENGEPMSYTPFNDGFKRAMKHVGIPADKYTPHDFRATCATEWLEAGIPMKTISAMLGHKDTRTTEKYYARIRPEIAYAGVAEMIDSHLEKQAAC